MKRHLLAAFWATVSILCSLLVIKGWLAMNAKFAKKFAHQQEHVSTEPAVNRNTVPSAPVMPPGCSNVVAIGDSWYEFDYKGHRYLFVSWWQNQRGYSALTRID